MTKHDEGKTRWDLLPMEQVEEIVDVITWGAKKYSDNGWQTLENAEERYFAAMMRHIAAHRRGERFDDESSLSHLAHAGACLLFLIWHDDQKVPEHIVIHDEGADMTAFDKYYSALTKQRKIKGFKYDVPDLVDTIIKEQKVANQPVKWPKRKGSNHAND